MSENYESNSIITFLGGIPPSNNDFGVWRNTLPDNLAPIQYKLELNSDLFDIITGISDKAKAKSQFAAALKTYCNVNKCGYAPAVDPPMPNPATLQISSSAAFGGYGGG